MVSVRTLPNGVTFIFDARAAAKTTSIVIGIRGGSCEEEYPGITHFLEHLITMRNPLSASFARRLDAIGMDMNAAISEDVMMVHCTVPSRNTRWALTLLASFVLDPGFDEKDVEREQRVILEDFHEVNEDLESVLEMLRNRVIFEGHPLGKPQLGPPTTLPRITYHRLVHYWQRLVDPRRLTITVVGKFDQRSLASLARTLFLGLERPLFPLPKRQYRAPQPQIEQCVFRHGEGHRVNFLWTVLLPGYRTRYRYACMALTNIIGGRYSSPLFLSLRDDGRIYNLDSDVWFFPEAGMLSIRSATTRRNLHPTLKRIHETLRVLRRDGVDQAEFELTLQSIRSTARIRFADTLYAAKFYTGQMLAHGHIISEQEFVRRITAMRREDLHAAARRFFRPRSWHITAIGPLTRRDKEKIRALIGSP